MAVLPEWCCLEDAHLVQSQDAENQERRELPEAHDASLQGKKDVIFCTNLKFYESKTLGSSPASTYNSLAWWLQGGHVIPFTHQGSGLLKDPVSL